MFQQINIIGNLGFDPEGRYTPSGQAVTSFSVAVSKKYTDKSGEKIEKTTWFKVTAWGKLAEVCNEYLQKGSRVAVWGEMQAPNVYEKKDGTHAANLELTASKVLFLSAAKQGEGTPYDPDED